MALSKGVLVGGIVAAGAGSFCCCGGVLLFYWLFAVTGEAAQAADEFLAALGQGRITEAYNSAASGLRSLQTEEAFAAEVKKLGLTEYASSSWSNRNLVNDQADLKGSITTRAGAILPMHVTLVKESGKWRVLTLTGAGPGPGVGGAQKTVPPDEELRRLVSATMVDFGAAVKAKDFKDFHGKLSTLLKKEKTPEDLQKAFQQFLSKENALPAIKDIPPVFNAPPALNDKGLLVVTGYFPTNPSRVDFVLTYTYEHPDWKLIAIDVKLAK